MKVITSAALAAVLLTGMVWPLSARAQGVPQGSYLASCTDVGVRDDTLVAICRTADGREQRASLAAVSRCVRDIGNNNGTLHCNYAGPPPRGQDPPPPPGELRYGEGPEQCRGLHHEAEELRDRLSREGDAGDRGRIGVRLHEIHEQEERCR